LRWWAKALNQVNKVAVFGHDYGFLCFRRFEYFGVFCIPETEVSQGDGFKAKGVCNPNRNRRR
jgi:hypothetical protein